jgi:Uma2 family endonuclease
MPTAVALVTFEDLERLPDEPGKTELLDGELIQMPPAMRRHSELGGQLFLRLSLLVAALKSGGAGATIGKVEVEMGYRIGRRPDSWLVPDVSVTHPDQPGDAYCEGAPLIAIEIISESNAARHVDRKIKKYLANGSQEVWALYPKTRRALTHFAGRDEVEVGRAHIRSRVLPEASGNPLSEIW